VIGVCVPTLSVPVVNVATPATMGTLDASGVAPSMNVTVPVGVPAPDVTVAVNVTDWPNTDGF